jgi:hypothetical protein
MSREDGGVNITGLLGILFVGLKLTGYIDWSWWWVTSPFSIMVGVRFLVVLGESKGKPR